MRKNCYAMHIFPNLFVTYKARCDEFITLFLYPKYLYARINIHDIYTYVIITVAGVAQSV
jgi:hypothetical protein